MISVDYCDGKQTLRGLPPERIGEFVRRNRTGDDSAAMESNGLAAGVAAAVGAENGTTASSGRRPPVLWVDVSAPTDDDWRTLADQFGFHPLAVEDAQKQHQRAKVDAYDGYLYLSARAWAGARDPVADLDEATQELDIFIGPNYLVTIHNGHLPSVAETRARWERYPAVTKTSPRFCFICCWMPWWTSIFPPWTS
jgi:Mg2+ and Co2+ transporter CorA